MRSSVVIDQAAAGSSRSLSWLRHYGGLSMLISMAVLFGSPDFAFAQYPGFSSDAEPASVSADASEARNDGSVNNSNAGIGNDEAASLGAEVGTDRAASNDFSVGDEGASQAASSGFGVTVNRTKALQSRDRYFVRKLRVEFAAMELVERRNGVAFSRRDVPRYLDELRAELAKMGEAAKAPVQSLARDVQHIDSELNKHIDKLQTMVGAPTTVTPNFFSGFFTSDPPLPKTADAAAGKIASVSLKYELMDYGEKALQAMGADYR